MVNEYNQIRKMLGKVRKLKEEAEQNQNNVFSDNPNISNNIGKKVIFNDIQTVGFYKSSGLDNNIKDNVVNAVGEFIKASGLLIKTINIMAEDGRIVLTTDTIKNPSTTNISQIIIDTNLESPEFTISGDNLSLTDELVTLFQSLLTSYNDIQIGREHLVSATQFNTDNKI